MTQHQLDPMIQHQLDATSLFQWPAWGGGWGGGGLWGEGGRNITRVDSIFC